MKNRGRRNSAVSGAAVVTHNKQTMQHIRYDKHSASVVAAFPDAFVTGKFCDVKIVCMVSDFI